MLKTIEAITLNEARNAVVEHFAAAVTPEKIRYSILNRVPLDGNVAGNKDDLIRQYRTLVFRPEQCDSRISGFYIYDENAPERLHTVWTRPILSLQQAVAKGIKFLDEKFPYKDVDAIGWRLMIDTAELNMFLKHKCILGQLFENYERGLRKLEEVDFDVEQAVEYGFTLPYFNSNAEATATYKQLTDEWKRQLV